MAPFSTTRLFLIAILALAAPAIPAQPLAWHIVGPPGGNLATVIRDSSGTLLAAWGNRVFRSTDGGRSWIASRAGTTFRYIQDLACDAGGTVIAAAEFGGIVKSTDGGATWRESNQGLGEGYYASVIITRSGSYVAGALGQGLYRSDDSGASWSQIKVTAPNGADYSNAGFNKIREGAPGELYVAFRRGLIRSRDGGTTWTFLDTAIFKSVTWSVEIAPWGDLYALHRDTLYRSSDRGDTWQKLARLKMSIAGLFVGDEIVYANTDDGLQRSLDSGRTWSPVPHTGVGPLWAMRGVLPPDDLYAIDDRGLVHSTDGESWESLSEGYGSTSVRRLASDSSGRVYAFSTGSGLYRTSNLGATWQRLTPVDTFQGTPNFQLTALSASGDRHLFVGTNRALFVSHDAGESFQRVNDRDAQVQSIFTRADGFVHVELDGYGYQSHDFGATWEALQRNPGAPNITMIKDSIMLASRNDGVYRSTDHGRTWEGIASDHYVVALAGTPDGMVFAATNQHRIIKSADNGNSWSECYSFPPSTLSLIRTKAGRLIASGDSLVVYSDDAGVTWHPLFEPEADIVLSTLLEGGDGYLYGGTETWGVLRSDRPSAVPMAAHRSRDRAIELSWINNPAGEHAILMYDLPETDVVHLRLHNAGGAVVRSYLLGRREAGRYTEELDVAGLPSGLYYCMMRCGARTAATKLLIVR